VNAIIDAAIDRSRTVIATLLLILMAGVFAYNDIAKEADPDVNIPIIYVSMSHDGISPEDAERLLVRPVELELRSIEGVKEMRATAADGFASVVLEFEAGFDADTAMDDVREKVDIAKVELPEDTDDPTVEEVNVGLFPVLVLTLSGDVPARSLLRIARKLQDTVEGLPGVLSADIAGEREDVLEVLVDPMLLESYEISQHELINAVNLNNRLVAAGSIDTGAGGFSVKVPGLFKTAKDVLELPIKVRGDGVVTLADITDIRRTFKDSVSYARLGGEPAVALEIRKRLGENIIDTIGAVRAIVAAKQAEWPNGIRVTFSQDKSDDIRNMLTDLQNNVISAILLVMVVVVAALGLRTAGLVGLAIPSSFLIGILYLYIFGMTINIVVLFSLILAVGMLVDGAIVVTEYADRKMAEKVHRRIAYAEAAKRMAWPIIASTATTLAVFMPLLFWPGVVGEFMVFLPITLITTLFGSLLMALIFVPTLGAQLGRAGATDQRALSSLAAMDNGALEDIRGLTGVYVKAMRLIVRFPLLIVLLAIGTLVGVQYYYATHGNGVEFFPNVEPEQAIVLIHARGNMSIDEKDALVREVENRVLELDDFASVYTRSGQQAQAQEASEDVVGTITLEFKEWQERRPSAVILADIRARTDNISGLVVEAREPEAGPPTGKPVQLQLTSLFPELLAPEVVKVRRYFESLDGLIDIEDSRPMPGIEWELDVDRAQAGRFGADIVRVGNVVQLVTNGIKVGDYRPDDTDEEVDIRLRFPLDDRGINQLDTLRVPTDDGLVPISNFVTRSPKQRVGTIERIDGKRKMAVLANVREGVLPSAIVKDIAAWLPSADIDPRVELTFKGEDEEQKTAQEFLMRAFAVALFIMAIILVTQFNSFYHTFLILSAVILSTIGVMMGLLITGQPFGIVMTGVGVITLAGIVVNNNIVLIDTYARLKRTGMDPIEAVIRTGAQRLRPVMLTAITTICGLLPMVFQVNIDFITRDIAVGAPSTQWWVQLATAVVFGLGFATLLTLVVTPSLLALGAKTSAWMIRIREPGAHPGDLDARPA
jgi:multidrug efflux pump